LQAAVTVDRARTDGDLARLVQRERTLRELTQTLAAHLDEARALELAVERAAGLLEAPYTRVWLLAPEGDLRCTAAHGFLIPKWESERLPVTSIAGLVLEGDTLNLPNAPEHPRWVNKDFLRRTGLAAYLGAPIRRAGQTLGVIETMRAPGHSFDATDEDALRVLADAVAIAVANARLYRDAQNAERHALQTDKLRALGQMAGGIAHDLNQSLGLVVGHGDLALQALENAEPDVARARESLRVIMQAAIDGGETVKGLLAFSRADPTGPPEQVDLGGLLHDVAKLTAPRWRDAAQMEGRAISMVVETNADAMITGWPASLREAFANLVLNAVDALPNGGSIRLTARRRGGRVEALVSDDGVGMSAEVQARAFEPFYTTKGERGTGLGLAVVFGIVERHEGEIDIESLQARGTTFRLSFPPAAQAEAEPALVATAAESVPLRILAVDDELELRQMAALMLRMDGHAVSTAGSGEDALALLETGEFDLVLSDIGMGEGMNGWELAEHVKARWPAR
jgi:signal transduction histidine kinase